MDGGIPIALGSDHAAFQLKEFIKKELSNREYNVYDFGVFSEDSADYPVQAKLVSIAVAKGEYSRGILFCGTGIGMSIAANKVKGIRAAVCWNEFTAKVSRNHNNSNILCLGGRVLSEKEALKIVEVWLSEKFEQGRHQKRITLIEEIEKESC